MSYGEWNKVEKQNVVWYGFGQYINKNYYFNVVRNSERNDEAEE